MDRATAFEAVGQGFESLWVCQSAIITALYQECGWAVAKSGRVVWCHIIRGRGVQAPPEQKTGEERHRLPHNLVRTASRAKKGLCPFNMPE